MSAPRIYININAKYVTVKRLTGDAIDLHASDSDDDESSETSSEISSGTTFSSTAESVEDTASYEQSEDSTDQTTGTDDTSADACDEYPGDEVDDDTYSDESTGSTEDGHVDDCPMREEENPCDDSQQAMDTTAADSPEHQLFEKYNRDEQLEDSSKERAPENTNDCTLLQVCFVYKNNVRTEQYVTPASGVLPSLIPRRCHISNAPLELYTVIRDSPCVESLLGLGGQYEIMIRMFDNAPKGAKIPSFVKVNTTDDGLPPIKNVISTVVYI